VCLNCGCMRPSDSHGKPANITISDLKKAVKAGGSKSVDEAMKNIQRTLKKPK
jgi:hypothetical protein